MRVFRLIASLVGALAALLGVGTGSASAAITSVLSGKTISGQAISCAAQTDGVRVCKGSETLGGAATDTRLKSFDGQPLALYVILPPAPLVGTDGNYPLVAQSHGWGGQAGGPGDTDGGPSADTWAKAGYAVLQLTARGFGDSCGKATSATGMLSCAKGYIRLDDDRYEVRDIQYAMGLLVDEGVADPGRLGATGVSYGGGVSLQLATLKNRVMNADGSVSPWKSPKGTSLSLAAAAPVIPWSDLVHSLVPNGRTLDYQIVGPSDDLHPLGVEKQSFVSGLYALGNTSGTYSPPGTDPQADLTAWYASINAGEPYDGNPEDESIASSIARYHSAYYLLDGAYGVPHVPPSPMLIANGFTDDLFPVDEGVRYYNLERSLYPSNPIALFDWDGGHQRGQNKSADNDLLSSRIQALFDHYVKGSGAQPQLGATALTQTCPSTAKSGGPYTASSWSALHPGQVFYATKRSETLDSAHGDQTISNSVDPIAGGGACATVSGSDQGTGVATYRLPAVTGSGYTLLGAPAIAATLQTTGAFPQIAARLWDVNPKTNTETLVARGVYRVDPAKPDGLQVFQLHPGAWHFAAGHIPKLELLGKDVPYVRASNGQFSITISGLELFVPVHEQPGSQPPVHKPKPPPKPHPQPRCVAYPYSSIDRKSAHSSRSGISLAGNAGEKPCAGASAATRRKEKVVHVYVMIYRGVGHGQCRFLQRNGKLSSPRPCTRPLEFLAKGTSKWSLKLRMGIPRGTYAARSDAVDGLGHHQRQSNSSRVTLVVK